MKKIIFILALIIAASNVHAEDSFNADNNTTTAKERELDKEIELLRLQESIRQQKAYEERMKEHAEKLDCIVCK